MLSQTTSSSTCHVTSYDKVSIGTADATRALRRNFTWTHETNTATYASNTERTLRLLFIETVKYSVATDLFHTKNHFTHSRVRSLLDNILLSRPCFTILSNGFKIIIYAMFMRHTWFMSVWHPFICRQSLFMAMIVTMVMIVMMVMIMVVVMVMMVVIIMMVVMVMMVMMTAAMAMMMFTMAMVMGIFIFHVFTHFKPPRGLRRPTANNKKTYSSSI